MSAAFHRIHLLPSAVVDFPLLLLHQVASAPSVSYDSTPASLHATEWAGAVGPAQTVEVFQLESGADTGTSISSSTSNSSSTSSSSSSSNDVSRSGRHKGQEGPSSTPTTSSTRSSSSSNGSSRCTTSALPLGLSALHDHSAEVSTESPSDKLLSGHLSKDQQQQLRLNDQQQKQEEQLADVLAYDDHQPDNFTDPVARQQPGASTSQSSASDHAHGSSSNKAHRSSRLQRSSSTRSGGSSTFTTSSSLRRPLRPSLDPSHHHHHHHPVWQQQQQVWDRGGAAAQAAVPAGAGVGASSASLGVWSTNSEAEQLTAGLKQQGGPWWLPANSSSSSGSSSRGISSSSSGNGSSRGISSSSSGVTGVANRPASGYVVPAEPEVSWFPRGKCRRNWIPQQQQQQQQGVSPLGSWGEGVGGLHSQGFVSSVLASASDIDLGDEAFGSQDELQSQNSSGSSGTSPRRGRQSFRSTSADLSLCLRTRGWVSPAAAAAGGSEGGQLRAASHGLTITSSSSSSSGSDVVLYVPDEPRWRHVAYQLVLPPSATTAANDGRHVQSRIFTVSTIPVADSGDQVAGLPGSLTGSRTGLRTCHILLSRSWWESQQVAASAAAGGGGRGGLKQGFQGGSEGLNGVGEPWLWLQPPPSPLPPQLLQSGPGRPAVCSGEDGSGDSSGSLSGGFSRVSSKQKHRAYKSSRSREGGVECGVLVWPVGEGAPAKKGKVPRPGVGSCVTVSSPGAYLLRQKQQQQQQQEKQVRRQQQQQWEEQELAVQQQKQRQQQRQQQQEEHGMKVPQVTCRQVLRRPVLMVVDLDALLGSRTSSSHSRALLQLQQLMISSKDAPGSRFVLTTRRDLRGWEEVLRDRGGALPMPDVIVADGGARVYVRETAAGAGWYPREAAREAVAGGAVGWREDMGWRRAVQRSGWDLEAARAVGEMLMGAFPGDVKLGPWKHQTRERLQLKVRPVVLVDVLRRLQQLVGGSNSSSSVSSSREEGGGGRGFMSHHHQQQQRQLLGKGPRGREVDMRGKRRGGRSRGHLAASIAVSAERSWALVDLMPVLAGEQSVLRYVMAGWKPPRGVVLHVMQGAKKGVAGKVAAVAEGVLGRGVGLKAAAGGAPVYVKVVVGAAVQDEGEGSTAGAGGSMGSVSAMATPTAAVGTGGEAWSAVAGRQELALAGVTATAAGGGTRGPGRAVAGDAELSSRWPEEQQLLHQGQQQQGKHLASILMHNGSMSSARSSSRCSQGGRFASQVGPLGLVGSGSAALSDAVSLAVSARVVAWQEQGEEEQAAQQQQQQGYLSQLLQEKQQQQGLQRGLGVLQHQAAAGLSNGVQEEVVDDAGSVVSGVRELGGGGGGVRSSVKTGSSRVGDDGVSKRGEQQRGSVGAGGRQEGGVVQQAVQLGLSGPQQLPRIISVAEPAAPGILAAMRALNVV